MFAYVFFTYFFYNLKLQEKTKILTKKLNEALAKISQMENLLEESRREMIHSNALNESNNTKLTELNIRFDQVFHLFKNDQIFMLFF